MMANVHSGYPDQPFRNSQGFNYPRNNDTNGTLQINKYWKAITSRKISILASFISIILLLCFLTTVMFMTLMADDSYTKIHFERDASTKSEENPVEKYDILTESPNSEYSNTRNVFEKLQKNNRQRLKRSTDQTAIEGCKKNRENCQQLINKVLSIKKGDDSNVKKIEELMTSLSKTGQNEVLQNLNHCLKCRKLEYERQIPYNDESHEWSSHPVKRNDYNNLFPMLNNGQPEHLSIPRPRNKLSTNGSEDFKPETSKTEDRTKDGENMAEMYKDIDNNQKIHISKTNVSRVIDSAKVTHIIKNTTIIEKPTTERISVADNSIHTGNGDYQNNGSYQNTADYRNTVGYQNSRRSPNYQNIADYQNTADYQNYLSSQNYENNAAYRQGQNYQGGKFYQQGPIYLNPQNQPNGQNYANFQTYGHKQTQQSGQNYQNNQPHQQGQTYQGEQSYQQGPVYPNAQNQQNGQNYQNFQNYQNNQAHQQGHNYQGGQSYQQGQPGFDHSNVQISQNGPLYPNPPSVDATKINNWQSGGQNFQPSTNPTVESSSYSQQVPLRPSMACFPFPICCFMPLQNMQASGSFPTDAVPCCTPNQQSFGMPNQKFFGTQNMMNSPQSTFSTSNGPVLSQLGTQYSQAQQPTNTQQGVQFEKIGPTGPRQNIIYPNDQIPSNFQSNSWKSYSKVDNGLNALDSKFHEMPKLSNVYGEETQSNGTEKLPESVTYVPPVNRFTCTNLIQIISMDKRCNGFYDCEDGTDEVNCTCKEILLRKNPTAICNGHIDCYDGSDEDDCASCGENEYHCRRSGTCIPLIKKCDRKLDCKLNEDELDCFTLSNGEYVNLDLDERPQLNLEGVITMFQNGTWVPFCYQPRSQNYANSQDHLGSRFCQYLGFRYLESVREFPVINGNLPERRNIIHYEYPPLYKFSNKDGNQTCSGLYIRCKPVLSSPVNTYLSMNQFSEEGTYQWPWQAGIFADGEYRCPAVLLESNWLLASSQCSQNINLKTNYTIGVFGVPSFQPPVYRPHQQVVEIDEIRSVRNSDSSLFHLKNPINRTRQVQAIFNENRLFPPTEKDTCLAFGVNKKYDSKNMFVKPVLECAKCHRCYIANPPTKCNNNTESRDWSGTVSCLGSGGWYPSAVFKNVNSICSFDKTEILDGIDYMYAHISEAMSKNLDPAEGPPCDGVRCLFGKCIPWNKVCDGIADCPDQADERPEQCQDTKQRCEHDIVGCKCSMNEMRCGNGKCIPKEKFCDGKKDCTDGTDEPQICNCAAFLAVTAKHRICDNKRDCFDKSDEDPNVCPCKDASFYCHKINRKRTCISSDMVCDNENDCPNGEDEMHCRKIQSALRNRDGTGEVIKQSFGVWHSDCFSTPVTSDMDAVNICRSMGFTTGIIANEISIQHKKPVIPEQDQFYMIRLNDRTLLTLRQDKPLITLVEPQETCHRLFVQCA